MKTISLLSSISLFCLLNSSFSQNEIKEYEQPKVSEGSNLILSSSPNYVNTESINYRKETYVALNLYLEFTKWRFSKKLNYSLDLSASNSYTYSSTENEEKQTSSTDYSSSVRLSGGASYYLYKDLLYTGLFTEDFIGGGKNGNVNFDYRLFPNIGTGRIVDAGRVFQMHNFEDILVTEKIINNPLPNIVKKKLTELLDRRHNSEFLDKYKDDNEIEFFAQVEQLLSQEGVIKTPLSSRTTLKLYQALTNSSFIYFPRYKGYLFQLEIDYEGRKTEDNTEFDKPDITLAGIYALPIGLKTDITASAFFTFPVNGQSLKYFREFQAHSLLTIQEYQRSFYYHRYLIPFYSTFEREDLSYVTGVKSNFLHNISQNIGITLSGEYAFAKRNTGGFPVSYDLNTILNYDILTKLRFDFVIGFERSYDARYRFNSYGSIYYYIF